MLKFITKIYRAKKLGIVRPRDERRYFSILATIRNSITFELCVTFIYFPNYRSIIIETLKDLNVLITDFNYFSTTSTNLLGPSSSPSNNSSNSSNSSPSSLAPFFKGDPPPVGTPSGGVGLGSCRPTSGRSTTTLPY